MQDRQRDAFDRDITLAYNIEALHRHRRLPDLKRLQARRRVGRQTPREQRLVLAALSEQFGIPVRVRRVPGSSPHGE